MRLLLDTHVAVWAVSRVERLSHAATALIEDTRNEVFVSTASLLEIAIKNSLGRPPRDPIGLTLAEAQQAFLVAEFIIIPIESSHLVSLEQMPPLHGDPFDRLIVATAQADTYRLVTHDRTLAAYGEHITLV